MAQSITRQIISFFNVSAFLTTALAVPPVRERRGRIGVDPPEHGRIVAARVEHDGDDRRQRPHRTVKQAIPIWR
jgi:hypothetical protein